MFDLRSFEARLKNWAEFRESLETSKDPFQDVCNYYNTAPLVSINTDPWNKSIWPTAWELVNENQYCSFCITLGICYTLELTERFKGSRFEIHIAKDNNNSSIHYYLLVDDSKVLGYKDKPITKQELPTTLFSQRIYKIHDPK
tara:strand:+ start:605 stop:1033 length:429 start_codon:yes stop_codon:yes gene_type:complete